MQFMRKGSIENVWIEGWDDHNGGNVSFDSATFEVFDSDDVSVQPVGAATISNNGTPTPDINGLVDTTTGSFVANGAYKVEFVVAMGSERLRPVVPIKLTEERL